MLYIRLENFVPVETSANAPVGKPSCWAMQPKTPGDYHNLVNTGTGWLTHSDIGTAEYATTLATLLTEKLGRTYLAADAGEGCYPRYDVIEAPMIGDKVSRAFNGDAYPCGEITRITPTWRITTSDGTKFSRRGDTGSWREIHGSFSMVNGHIYEQNPSF